MLFVKAWWWRCGRYYVTGARRQKFEAVEWSGIRPGVTGALWQVVNELISADGDHFESLEWPFTMARWYHWRHKCSHVPFISMSVWPSSRSNFDLWPLKGQCHDIQWFFALFLREQKMAVARASVADIRSESLAVRAAWQPGHLCWLLTWQCRKLTTSRARVALLHLSTATGSTFVFRLRGPSKVISPSSRIEISSDSYIYRFFIRVFGSARLPKLASTISSPRAWVTGRRTRQCGRSSVSSDFDDVCHCEGKCAERGTSSRNGCRRSCQHRLCCGIRTVRDKDLKTQETHLW